MIFVCSFKSFVLFTPFYETCLYTAHAQLISAVKEAQTLAKNYFLRKTINLG